MVTALRIRLLPVVAVLVLSTGHTAAAEPSAAHAGTDTAATTSDTPTGTAGMVTLSQGASGGGTGSRALQVPGSVASVVRGLSSGSSSSQSGSLGPTVVDGDTLNDSEDNEDTPEYHFERYVALGDSYASMGSVLPGHWMGGPPQCIRSADAYPPLLAQALDVSTFVNATCASAVSAHLWNNRDVVIPPQLDALTEDTDLVTVTIGFNDVGFAEIVATCLLPTPIGGGGPLTPGSVTQAGGEILSGVAGSVMPPTSADLSATASTSASAAKTATEAGIDITALTDTLNDTLDTMGGPPSLGDPAVPDAAAGPTFGSGSTPASGSQPDSPPGSHAPSGSGSVAGTLSSTSLNPVVRTSCGRLLTEDVPQRIADLSIRLDEVFTAIGERSPNATVVATGYLSMVPLDESRCPMIESLSPADAAAYRDFEQALGDTIAAAAQRHDVVAVTDINQPGHDMCAAPSDRWVDLLGLATAAGAFHPTAAGQTHLASEIADQLGARVAHRREGTENIDPLAATSATGDTQ